jgi:DNA-binding transcriptional LysR family regulator
MKNDFAVLTNSGILGGMQWDDLRCFIAVADAGTLSAAARRVGLSVATIGRRLDALEAALGLRLADRSPEGAALTGSGHRVLALAQAGADQLVQIERVAAALRRGEWSDPVRITATEPIVSEILAPALPALWRSDPRIRIELQSSTEVARLASREADIAIRLFEPKGDSLFIRKLPVLSMSVYASRLYLGGRAADEVDLGRERLLSFNDSYGRIPETTWIETLGLEGRVAFKTSSTRALLKAVSAGAGLALLPDLFARRVPGLVPIPMAKALPSRTPWLVVHRDLRRARHLRPVRAWIVQSFKTAIGTGTDG